MSKVILFQGDSITDAHRSRDNDQFPGSGYPTLVKARLGFDFPNQYTFFNRGISGNRIVDLYARIKSDIINLKPDYLSILIGVNDVWHELGGVNNGVSAEKFEMVYDWLMTEIKTALPDIKIMLMEPFVLEGAATCNTEQEPTRWEYFQKEVALRADAARRIALRHQLPIIALQHKFNEACALAPSTYWLADGVHPTAMGHELIAREWMNTFRKYF